MSTIIYYSYPSFEPGFAGAIDPVQGHTG